MLANVLVSGSFLFCLFVYVWRVVVCVCVWGGVVCVHVVCVCVCLCVGVVCVCVCVCVREREREREGGRESRWVPEVRLWAGKQEDLGSIPLRLSSLFRICGLWILSCDNASQKE